MAVRIWQGGFGLAALAEVCRLLPTCSATPTPTPTPTPDSQVSPVFLPIFLDGCDFGEYLDTSRSTSTSTSSSSTSASSPADGSADSSLSGVLAQLETASCVPCPRRQLSQVSDPRPLLGAEDSFPASLPDLQAGVHAAQAVCARCPDHGVCPGGR